MPVELHERLSEFSYGYGVTREAQEALESVGLSAVPFLPSLLHEAELGFDVGFNRPGAPLLLQFKLGQAMRRFVPGPRPLLSPGFWRFQLDTAEPDGQYELLLRAEQDGAEVYYVAPMFHDWEIYLRAFGQKAVLKQSLLVTPVAIRTILNDHSIPDGLHKVVYDKYRAYLCSEPRSLKIAHAREMAEGLRDRIAASKTTLGDSLRRLLAGFGERAQIRRREVRQTRERTSFAIPSDSDEGPALRRARLENYRERFPTEDDAVAAAVAAEVWGSGIQLVMATLN